MERLRVGRFRWEVGADWKLPVRGVEVGEGEEGVRGVLGVLGEDSFERGEEG